MENPTISLSSIDAYNRIYGLPTLHPLASVIDLRQATRSINHVRMKYGVYALFLKNGIQCSLKYGRRTYDYQEGTVVSFAPGQTVDVDMEQDLIAPDVRGLIFHPDLIYGTPLADKIARFRFFDYSQVEALHLSDDERSQFLFCLDLIQKELTHPVDHHSASVISANIQLLLEYMDRFYDRQFITRHKVNSEIVARFEADLKSYYSDPAKIRNTPSVAYFASLASLTPGYFGDLVRKETGMSPKDIIALHIIDLAKQRLTATSDDVSQIAYDLGYDYPAHFSRMFKRITGKSPSQYRLDVTA